MKINEAIQQKRPFRNVYQEATVNLIFTNNWVTSQIQGLLKSHGITLKQYNVLRILNGAGKPVSTSIIRDRLLDKMSDASRLVERMYQKGLVDRTVSADDKRLVDVTLSKKGRDLMGLLNDMEPQLDKIIGGNLSVEEASQLSYLLDKVRG